MKSLLLTLCVLSSLPFVAAQSAPAATAAARRHPDPSAAIEKHDPSGRFLKLHESYLARTKEGPIGLLFLGDSITEGWHRAPHIWEHFYGKDQPANFGISGDRTEHVIWRIEHGELDGIHPKVVVLMIGTNNTGDSTADEIAAADKKIVGLIRTKLPDTKVLLLAVFPRGAHKDKDGVVTAQALADAARRMKVINAVNAQLAQLDDGRNVRYLDIGAQFLGQDGRIPFTIMPDQLHPNAAGYELWAEAMQPLLSQMMRG